MKPLSLVRRSEFATVRNESMPCNRALCRVFGLAAMTLQPVGVGVGLTGSSRVTMCRSIWSSSLRQRFPSKEAATASSPT